MTEAPETIWVELTPIDLGSSDGPFWTVKGGIADIQWGGATSYRRADLPPKVKPLEWSTDGFPRAVTILGDYVVLEWRRGPQLTFNRGATQVMVKDCDSTAEAKAAAQADYEARILAALVQP